MVRKIAAKKVNREYRGVILYSFTPFIAAPIITIRQDTTFKNKSNWKSNWWGGGGRITGNGKAEINEDCCVITAIDKV